MPCAPASAEGATTAKPAAATLITNTLATTPRTPRTRLMLSTPPAVPPVCPNQDGGTLAPRSHPAHGPSAKARQALGDVGEPGVLAADPVEQRPGPGHVAGPLLEVGQGVPEPQVVRLGLGHLLVGTGEE